MLGKKSFIDKAFVISLICMFLSLTSCGIPVGYRNMQPTGEYTVLNRQQIEQRFTFQVVRFPSVEKPSLEIRYGKYPIYEELRKSREYGEYKHPRNKIVGLSISAAGAVVLVVAVIIPSSHEVARETAASGGGSAFLLGLALAGLANYQPWIPAYRDRLQTMKVDAEKEFEPISNIKIRAIAPSISKEWFSSTDSQGRIFLDMPPIARLVRDRGDLAITFQTMDTAVKK